MTPKALQLQVWATYRAGQCDDKQPSSEWLDAADNAIAAVAEIEALRHNGAAGNAVRTQHEKDRTMGRYAKAGTVDQYAKGEYFACLSGRYRVRIGECKAIEAREAGLATIVEMEVLEVIVDPVEARDHEGKPKAKKGDARSWYLDMRKDAAWPDLQGFLGLAFDVDIATMKVEDARTAARRATTGEMGEIEKLAEWLVSPDQPLRGLELVVVTFNRPTRAKNRPFTIHRWFSVDGLTAAASSDDSD